MQKKLIALILGIIILATSWSLFRLDFFRVHDYTHGARISEMTRALEDGHFPVRWTENFGYGYGMPLFEFYAPLPYYVGSAIYWLFGDIIISIKFLFFVSNIFTAIGGFFLGQCLVKLIKGKSKQSAVSDQLKADVVGITLSALLTLAPYRAVNLYVRGAVSEAWAIMALPWILLGLVLIVDRKKKGWVILVLSLVALFLSHNLTTMIFVPMSLIFFLLLLLFVTAGKRKPFYAKKKIQFKELLQTIIKTASSYLLAIGMTAFYLVPSFFEKDFTKVERYVLDAYFNFRLHFLYLRQFFSPNWGYGGSAWGVDDEISFFLGYGQIAGVILLFFILVFAFYTYFKNRKKKSSLLIEIIFVGGVFSLFLISILMTTMKTQFIWELISLFEFLQFPWRWLSVSIVFLSVSVSLSLIFLNDKKTLIFTSGTLILVTLLGNTFYFKPEKYTTDPLDFYYTDEQKIRHAMSDILQDYIPKDVPEKIPPVNRLLDQEYSDEEIQVSVNRTHEKLLQTNLSSTTHIELHLADYPGWEVQIDGEPHEHVMSDSGLIQFSVPEGSHLVTVQFKNTPVRSFADSVSIIAWSIFMYLLISIPRRRS